jgi:signal transduction histidine kinase
VSERSSAPVEPTRWRRRLATPNTALRLGALVLLLALGYLLIALAATDAQNTGIFGSSVIEALVFAGLGVLVARRRPRHPVGWILIGVGLTLALSADGSLYAVLDYRNHQGQLPLGALAELLNLFWIPGILLIPLGVLNFPDGVLPSQRWRSGVWAYAAIGAALVVAFYAVAIGDLTAPRINIVPSTGDIAEFDNPAGALGALYTVWAALVSIGSVAALVALAMNYRRSSGERRQQLKWFLLGTGIFLLIALPAVVIPNANLGPPQLGPTIFDIAFLAPPITIAIGILKYRLYDVDVVISRTLVYGALAAFITAVYVGIAVGLGALVGSGGKSNLGLSIVATAIVAVGFQPVRQRLQKVANRLVYGTRATPYEVLSQFSERVAESYAVDDVMPRMARVLAEGTGAQRADIWLRAGGSLHVAASWPADAAPRDPVAVTDGVIAMTSSPDRIVAVSQSTELLGALSVTKRAGEQLTPMEEKLLDDLAHQAGLVLSNVALTADLQLRLEELRASRQRVVSAQDEERRRLERNLHDGAQQHLVALKVKLGLAEMLLGRDAGRASATLEQLKTDADEALETLRDLARGIYPPLLADRGLVAAVESQARKATVAVRVDGQGTGRYSQEVEAAVYFSVLEALQNVQKYAGASSARVTLRESEDRLEFRIEDDGRGFDVATVARGSGLTNMEDRLDALGGELRVVSSVGKGTSLQGWLAITPQRAKAALAAASG